MALISPPLWLRDGSHTARGDRMLLRSFISTSGIVEATDLAVTLPGGLFVSVAAGHGFILGPASATQGCYHAFNDAASSVAVPANSSGNPRIDRVELLVGDSEYAGTADNVTFYIHQGTPAASPVAPALSDYAISLATYTLASGAAAPTSLVDTRVRAAGRLMATKGESGSGTSWWRGRQASAGTIADNTYKSLNLSTKVEAGGAFDTTGPTWATDNVTMGATAAANGTYQFVVNMTLTSTNADDNIKLLIVKNLGATSYSSTTAPGGTWVRYVETNPGTGTGHTVTAIVTVKLLYTDTITFIGWHEQDATRTVGANDYYTDVTITRIA